MCLGVWPRAQQFLLFHNFTRCPKLWQWLKGRVFAGSGLQSMEGSWEIHPSYKGPPSVSQPCPPGPPITGPVCMC